MANSIKEYPAVADALHTYTTPAYLNETDIKVYVDDVLQTQGYVINGEALNFTVGSLPQADQTVRIERVSESTSRSVDYTDGSLLNAETLDKDATQLFHIAQEAYDQARVTNMASGKFYYSQIEAPENPEEGTLWYNKSVQPNVLQIWDGNEWYAATPLKTTSVYDTSHVDYNTESGDNDSFSLHEAQVNSNSNILFNGVRLRPSSDLANLGTDGDYFIQPLSQGYVKLWLRNLAADDVVTIETFQGGYATTIDTEVANFNTNLSTINARLDVVEPQISDIEALNVPQVVVDINQAVADVDDDKELAKKFATHPRSSDFQDDAGITRKSALHYAAEAADSAETARVTAAGANDPIEGWAALDNETLTTTSANDPIIYSNGTLTLKADSGVVIEGDLTLPQNVFIGGSVSSPFVQGFIDETAETWTGTAGVTITNMGAKYKWKIEHNELTGMNYIAHVTVNNTGSTSSIPVAKVERHAGYLEVETYELSTSGTGNAVNDAQVYIEIYKFN